MEEVADWICPCGTLEEYKVLRGSRSKIRGGVARFNQVEESVVMELAKLGDMLTTQAWEAIIGKDEGVVVTALDCEGWCGWYTEDTCKKLIEEITGKASWMEKPTCMPKCYTSLQYR